MILKRGGVTKKEIVKPALGEEEPLYYYITAQQAQEEIGTKQPEQVLMRISAVRQLSTSEQGEQYEYIRNTISSIQLVYLLSLSILQLDSNLQSLLLIIFHLHLRKPIYIRCTLASELHRIVTTRTRWYSENVINRVINIYRFILNGIAKAPFSILSLRNISLFSLFYCPFMKFIIKFNRGLNKFV